MVRRIQMHIAVTDLAHNERPRVALEVDLTLTLTGKLE